MHLEPRLWISSPGDEIKTVCQRTLSAGVFVVAVGACRLESLECEMNYTSQRKADQRLTLGRVRSLTAPWQRLFAWSTLENRLNRET